MKTYAAWGESRQSLDHFLLIGDVVDEEMADYFIKVLPPVSMLGHLIQIGEPVCDVGGRPTYATLRRNSARQWVYRRQLPSGRVCGARRAHAGYV